MSSHMCCICTHMYSAYSPQLSMQTLRSAQQATRASGHALTVPWGRFHSPTCTSPHLQPSAQLRTECPRQILFFFVVVIVVIGVQQVRVFQPPWCLCGFGCDARRVPTIRAEGRVSGGVYGAAAESCGPRTAHVGASLRVDDVPRRGGGQTTNHVLRTAIVDVVEVVAASAAADHRAAMGRGGVLMRAVDVHMRCPEWKSTLPTS
eukprot:TRINITY_DN2781_c0_g2_i1.p3 TRINITY_DN2781_c0_g2~~TRINITY_DN2781_c0_g2_i1.p3  ORF type:complete len:205 (+),score=17.16 TRINITY_DN2781_c0_g2_i1:1598-2212(+)